MMDLINKVNYEINKLPNLRILSSALIPCLFCVDDLAARREMAQVTSLTKDDPHFTKDLIATYHTMFFKYNNF